MILPMLGWLFIIAGVAWFLYLKYELSIEKRTLLQEQAFIQSELNKKNCELSDVGKQKPELLNKMYQTKKEIDDEYDFIKGILSRISLEETERFDQTSLEESINKAYRCLEQLNLTSGDSNASTHSDNLVAITPLRFHSLILAVAVAIWIILTPISIAIAKSFPPKSKGTEVHAYSEEGKIENAENEKNIVSSASVIDPKLKDIVDNWNSNSVVDFKDETVFEKALNNGENVVGKTVTFTVLEVHPGTPWGINLWAGEHLNFYSEEKVGIEGGDKITVLVTYSELSSNGYSHSLKYILLEKVGGKPQREGFKVDGSNKTIVIASNIIELPSYFEEAQVDNNKNSFFTYAERGQNLVYFDVRLYTSFSNFDDLNANKEEWMDSFMKGFVESFDDGKYSKTVFSEYTVKAGKGIIAKNAMSGNISSSMNIRATNMFYFLPVKNGFLVFMISTSDQSTWSYANDFEKIINSVKIS